MYTCVYIASTMHEHTRVYTPNRLGMYVCKHVCSYEYMPSILKRQNVALIVAATSVAHEA